MLVGEKLNVYDAILKLHSINDRSFGKNMKFYFRKKEKF